MSKPNPKQFTPGERRLIGALRTPYQVQRYLNTLPYNHERRGDTLRSFRGVVRAGQAHCLEAALFAGVVLEQHGFPVRLLDLESWDKLDHVLFLFRHKGLWGSVGRSRDPGLHGRRPVFPSVRRLVDSYFDPFVDYSGRIIGFATDDLSALGDFDWRLSRRYVWPVEKHLIKLKHTRFKGSDRRYGTWLTRFEEFKKRHPDKKPLYYRERKTWYPIPSY